MQLNDEEIRKGLSLLDHKDKGKGKVASENLQRSQKDKFSLTLVQRINKGQAALCACN